jgi:ATP-dependent exoDNAse (exonuclease V) alpha subunit
MTQSTALSILKLGYTTFLTGAAGTGKSYVLREYISYLKRHGVRYAITASTGIASSHIQGMTIHSWSGIGIKDSLSEYDIENLLEKQQLYKRFNDTQVLIIDEVSMLRASFLDTLNTLAKAMRRNSAPFGGMQVIFSGDFFQLPPVVRGLHQDDEAIFAYDAIAWKEAKPVVCYLDEQYRQNDSRLSTILQAIREGSVEEDHYDSLLSRKVEGSSLDILKLYTHNENVDAINDQAFALLTTEIREYVMATKGKAQLVASLKNNCLAPEVLKLRVGAKVICIKNAQDRSYVNGSMGEVTSFSKDGSPVVTLKNGRQITLTQDTWKIEEDGKVKAEIAQIPLRLAWAITIHKSQGMTLDEAEIDLSRTFAYGQGYVALSRLTSLQGLHLRGFNGQAFMMSDSVREVDQVFKQKSDQAVEALKKYDKQKLQALHEKFLLASGGSVTEQEVKDSDVEVVTPSHEKTASLLKDGKTLEEVALLRELSLDTILGHIEKIIELQGDVPLDHVIPKEKEFDKIAKTFKKLATRKLTPVYDALHGKVPYTTLRIVRAYLRL